jgi:Aspartyl/Asparaginyl beta-hydroxylase
MIGSRLLQPAESRPLSSQAPSLDPGFVHRPRFPDRLRLPLRFDPTRLAEDLARVEASGWIRHYVPDNYEGDWSVVPLRAPAGETHPLRMIYADPTATAFVSTPLLDECPYFREVMGAFQCPLRTVRLMRLTPGSVIKEHFDHELSFEDGMVRVHVPVVTNDGVDFRLNGERVVMEAGSAWYLRLSDPHTVANRGGTDRVHMVIDGFVNEWVKTLFESVAAAGMERMARTDPASAGPRAVTAAG